MYGVFEAELLEKTHTVDPTLDVAIEVKGASFTWDSPPPDADDGKPGKKGTSGGRMMQSSKSKAKAKAFAAAAEKATDHTDLYEAMVALYPDRLNRGVLWNSATALMS